MSGSMRKNYWKLTKTSRAVLLRCYIGKDNVTEINYVQTQVHRDLYILFDELVQLDGTYRTNKTAMPLYTLMVVDNFGVGEPVAIIFMKDENTQNIQRLKSSQMFTYIQHGGKLTFLLTFFYITMTSVKPK